MKDSGEYTLRGPHDFVRLDRLCAELLGRFFQWLQSDETGKIPPEEAGLLAHAADRYLRDFVVDIKETGPADEDPTLGRQYVSNWYIIHTLSPSHAEIERILKALRHLYRFLARERIVSPEAARAARDNLGNEQFFHDRLEDFWELTPEAIPAWRAVDDYRKSKEVQ